MSISRLRASLNPRLGDAILKVSVPFGPGSAPYCFEVPEMSSKDAEKASKLSEKHIPIGGVRPASYGFETLEMSSGGVEKASKLSENHILIEGVRSAPILV